VGVGELDGAPDGGGDDLDGPGVTSGSVGPADGEAVCKADGTGPSVPVALVQATSSVARTMMRNGRPVGFIGEAPEG
jgi:hypothetical protein